MAFPLKYLKFIKSYQMARNIQVTNINRLYKNPFIHITYIANLFPLNL